MCVVHTFYLAESEAHTFCLAESNRCVGAFVYLGCMVEIEGCEFMSRIYRWLSGLCV